VAVVGAERVRDVLAEYDRVLASAALAPGTRRAYRSRVAGYLGWLSGDQVGGSDLGGGDPLGEPGARDRAVREYRSWMKRDRDAKPTTVNAILTALDHFYEHLRLGPAVVVRDELPEPAARVLNRQEQHRFLHAVERHESVRDQAIGYALFYTGVRVAELVALDVPDIQATAKRATVVVRPSRHNPYRELPLEADAVDARRALRVWMRERNNWPGADASPAFFLNRRGGRLTTRWISELVVRLGQAAGIGGPITPNVLRHTFAARLLHGGADIVLVAELMGYKRLDTARPFLVGR
jgi:integrase/recombinase XerC